MENHEKILLVDDEEGILKLLQITLNKERYSNITCSTTGHQALALIRQNSYDLILLDVTLPDTDGFELCREIRKISHTPIIFVTSCTSDFDKLTGLSIGGDDYITKPFNPLEVVARIKAFFRRQGLTKAAHSPLDDTRTYQYASFTFSPADARLIVDGAEVECTAKELELLHFFCRNPNRLFTSSQIYEYVWGNPGYGEEKTVTMHISKIRKKLGDNPKAPQLILNLRGIGYKFVPPKASDQGEETS